MLDGTCGFAQHPRVLEPALLTEHCDESIGVTVPESVVVLEPRDLLHVFEVTCVGVEQPHPMVNWLTVLLLDGGEVRLGALHFLGHG